MWIRTIAVTFIALPFVFGALRLITTGYDARFLWTAVASTAGAGVILLRSAARTEQGARLTTVATLVAGVCAAASGVALGATSPGAIAAVALGFGACSAGGLSLWRRATTR